MKTLYSKSRSGFETCERAVLTAPRSACYSGLRAEQPRGAGGADDAGFREHIRCAGRARNLPGAGGLIFAGVRPTIRRAGRTGNCRGQAPGLHTLVSVRKAGRVDSAKYRAWFYERQGLAGGRFASAREALAGAGWQRSVGGVNPYLGVRARSGEGRAEVDTLAADLQIFELPSARGCTYVLPADHFALGLVIGRPFGSAAEVVTARKLGVEAEEIDGLKAAVADALRSGPLAPVELKSALGTRVRNLGEEGKRRGLTTTLPVALGLLQTEGIIRRKPTNGRLDTQRYAYELWEPPLARMPDEEEAATEVAKLFFHWTGAATLKEFRDFSAFTLRDAQAACERHAQDTSETL